MINRHFTPHNHVIMIILVRPMKGLSHFFLLDSSKFLDTYLCFWKALLESFSIRPFRKQALFPSASLTC